MGFSQISKQTLILSLTLLLIFGAVLGWGLREQGRRVTYVIPAGTQQRIAAGDETVSFPDEISLTVGLRDTIIINNRDDVVHAFGPFIIGPQATFTKRFDNPVTYHAACTFHQDEQMRLVVHPAPWSMFQ